MLDLDFEVWIKSGPDDIKGKVFIYKEEHKLRLGSNKGLSIMEGREVHPAPSAAEGERWVCRVGFGSKSDWRQMKVKDKTLTKGKD